MKTLTLAAALFSASLAFASESTYVPTYTCDMKEADIQGRCLCHSKIKVPLFPATFSLTYHHCTGAAQTSGDKPITLFPKDIGLYQRNGMDAVYVDFYQYGQMIADAEFHLPGKVSPDYKQENGRWVFGNCVAREGHSKEDCPMLVK